MLYEFIGVSCRLSEGEVRTLLASYGIVDSGIQEPIIDLLVWWGFFGIVRDDDSISYLYDVQYNMNHMRALIRKAKSAATYHINPAFWAGLEVRH